MNNNGITEIPEDFRWYLLFVELDLKKMEK